jgi:hypothetical protein
MSLSVNVGLSRKASKDYQSAGISINVTAELDQSLLTRPEELQRQVAALYAEAQHALEQQAAGGSVAPLQSTSVDARTNGAVRRNVNRNRNGTDLDSHDVRKMTDSQMRAIRAIGLRADIDPEEEARRICGAELKALTLRQASGFIDHLHRLTRTPDAHGAT